MYAIIEIILITVIIISRHHHNNDHYYLLCLLVRRHLYNRVHLLFSFVIIIILSILLRFLSDSFMLLKLRAPANRSPPTSERIERSSACYFVSVLNLDTVENVHLPRISLQYPMLSWRSAATTRSDAASDFCRPATVFSLFFFPVSIMASRLDMRKVLQGKGEFSEHGTPFAMEVDVNPPSLRLSLDRRCYSQSQVLCLIVEIFFRRHLPVITVILWYFIVVKI